MIFKHLKAGLPVTDEAFDSIYPENIRHLAEFHFTPVAAAAPAARFLAGKPGARVLDIGSGAGKFCMIGAAFTTGHFTGVEQRESLYLASNRVLARFGLPNVRFIHANITEIGFDEFNAFYCFNPFYENMDQTGRMDDSIPLDKKLYPLYSSYVREQLEKMPAGTRLATYFSYSDEIPPDFVLQSSALEGKLKFWEKAGQ